VDRTSARSVCVVGCGLRKGCYVGSKQLRKISQVSDLDSIPIARSITHDDSIGLAHLNCLNLAEKWPSLDPQWTPVDRVNP
jgi:hypothetical protein